MADLAGADIDRLRETARMIDAKAQTLVGITGATRSGIEGSAGFWAGDDAASFRNQWRAVHAPDLVRCSEALRDMADTIRRNADAQDDTSAAVDSGGTADLLRGATFSGSAEADGFGLGISGSIGLPGIDLPSPGDLWDGATDAWGGVQDGVGWLGDRASDAWGEVEDGVGRLVDFGDWWGREVGAPTVARWWNESANPWLVGQLVGRLEGHIGDPSDQSGDLDYRGPGGEFLTRVPLDRAREPIRFEPRGDEPVEVGRDAIVRTLRNTADDNQIHADEFQIIEHDNGTYTVVLPGVTDLSAPDQGLSDVHRSVRDTDYVAVHSAADATIESNRYAQLVEEYIRENVPAGSDIAIVGHSFGADTALDLASDPHFNGDDYTVTHVVAAAYHSEPQIPRIQDGTEVLVLQNNRDIPVFVEELGRLPSYEEVRPGKPPGIIVDEFDGGSAGAGHAQSNYIERVEGTDDPAHEEFFASWAEAGYGDDGDVRAVDVSVPPIP